MTTRMGYLSGMLLTVALSSGLLTERALVGGWPTREHLALPTSRDAYGAGSAATDTRCTDAANAIAAEWGVRNEWRALAPYPFPREASPTATMGVWVERLHLDDGRVELRRVSASRTDVASIDAASCVASRRSHVRSFPASLVENSLTDSRLDSLVRINQRGMIYVWSPRMPLSVSGLEQARRAARELGVSFTAVVAETNNAELASVTVDSSFTWRMESLELLYRNATIHYPTALFYNAGRIVDGAFPGYKNVATYVMFAERQFGAGSQTFASAATVGNVATQKAPKFWVDKKARVTEVSSVNTLRRIGFFFKPITGTNFVSYTARSKAYFFNIKTNEEVPVPGHVDPVPTPDGRFLTLPGLIFHRVPMLLAGDATPMFADPLLPDEYQTASILSETASNVRYRIVTGWNAGARFRDYDVAMDAKGTPVGIKALAQPFAPCTDLLLTLPINAKSGTEFGAFDAKAKTNLILDVIDATHCAVKLDLGFASGKISFSYDGQSIAFATSRINTDAEGPVMRPSELEFKDALVLVRKTGRIVSLSQNAPINGVTFPEFQKDGTVMLLDQVGPGRAVEQLRVVSYK
ncbi:MAG: hypothetical protein H7Z40_02990 [Phycisphaerae bacterium]|nr:hypothetical protein [Gemmatimonadaceae bacterium]